MYGYFGSTQERKSLFYLCIQIGHPDLVEQVLIHPRVKTVIYRIVLECEFFL